MGWYRSLLVRVGGTRLGARLVRDVLSPLDRRLYGWSGGRVLSTGRMVFPMLLLTTIGRRSGQERTVPLIYVRDGERLIVATGHVSAGRQTAWPVNLLANPVARVQVGDLKGRYRARLVTGPERDGYWARMLEVWPPYAAYEARSGDSKVFVLEPAEPELPVGDEGEA